MTDRADVSLLFDLFVATQRIRRVLASAMEGSGMRADEYAVYSLLFEKGPLTATEMSRQLGLPLSTLLDYLKTMDRVGHLGRVPHPVDGRAISVGLSSGGVAAQRRANASWEVARRAIEEALPLPVGQVRVALRALDDAAVAAQRSVPPAAPAGHTGKSRHRRPRG